MLPFASNLSQLSLKRFARFLLGTEGNLEKKVIRGGFWLAASKLVRIGLYFVRTTLLARLLLPFDFGLLGISLLTLNTLSAFTNTGFDPALIKKKDNTEPYLNTAWTIQFLRGLVLGGIMVAAAVPISSFFSEPKAVLALRLVGLAQIIKGLNNIGIIYFRKELDFNKQFLYQVISSAVDLILSAAGAVIFGNVWGLLIGLLARNVTEVVVSYLLHSYRPSFNWDLSKINELTKFGRWIFASSVCYYIGYQGDDLLVGRLLGATALGLYQMAFTVANYPISQFTYVINNIMFPAYSKLQGNTNKLKKAYIHAANLSSIFTFPITIGAAILSREFVLIFLGAEWVKMIFSLKLLSIAVLLKSVASTATPVLKGSGHPRYSFNIQLTRAVSTLVLIFPLINFFGMNGAAWTVLITNSLLIISWWRQINRLFEFSVKNVVQTFGPPLLAALVMGALAWILKTSIPIMAPNSFRQRSFLLSLAVVPSAVVYFLSLAVFSRWFGRRNQVMKMLGFKSDV